MVRSMKVGPAAALGCETRWPFSSAISTECCAASLPKAERIHSRSLIFVVVAEQRSKARERRHIVDRAANAQSQPVRLPCNVATRHPNGRQSGVAGEVTVGLVIQTATRHRRQRDPRRDPGGNSARCGVPARAPAMFSLWRRSWAAGCAGDPTGRVARSPAACAAPVDTGWPG